MTDQPATEVVVGPGASELELGLTPGQTGWSLAELRETSSRPATLEWLEVEGGR
jgi:hypothetical protein